MEINQFPVADKEMAPAISEVTRGRWRLGRKHTLPMETVEKNDRFTEKKSGKWTKKKGIRMDLAKISIAFFVSRIAYEAIDQA